MKRQLADIPVVIGRSHLNLRQPPVKGTAIADPSPASVPHAMTPLTPEEAAEGGAREIVSGAISGGVNTSHTIMVRALAEVLDAVPVDAPSRLYEHAIVESNVLAKATEGARRRSLRYLRELYLLRPDSLLFRALRDLWLDDPQARPLLAGLCALARDPVFRASSEVIFRSHPGEIISAQDFVAPVAKRFPGAYRDTTLAKIGRNVFSSWEQVGHLAKGERLTKNRKQPACQSANLTYALMLGYLEGARGQALFQTFWAEVLDQPMSHLHELAVAASQRGLLEFRHAGGVVEVGFKELVRPFGEESA